MLDATVSDPTPAVKKYTDEIEVYLRELKEERDLWKARAEAYRAAFEDQTRQLQEAVDICVATQAELENERATKRHRHDSLGSTTKAETYSGKSLLDDQQLRTLACDGAQDAAKIHVEWQSTPLTHANFGHVEQLVSHHDLPKARNAIDRLLPGPLSNEARVEGLLLKSAICRASGPDWLLEGLAQCSEALALCDRISSLESLSSKIQYHRGLCHYLLRELPQARAAFAAVEPADPLHDRATEYRKSCDSELVAVGVAKRRSAFEEHRTIEGYLSQSKHAASKRSKRRASSTRSKYLSVSKPHRLSLPHRWMTRTTT